MHKTIIATILKLEGCFNSKFLLIFLHRMGLYLSCLFLSRCLCGIMIAFKGVMNNLLDLSPFFSPVPSYRSRRVQTTVIAWRVIVVHRIIRWTDTKPSSKGLTLESTIENSCEKDVWKSKYGC